MTIVTFIARHRLAFSLSLLSALVAIAQWLMREQPLVVGPLRFDSVNLFFGFSLLFGACLAAWNNAIRLGLREALFALMVAVALVVRSTTAIAILYVGITLCWLLLARVSNTARHGKRFWSLPPTTRAFWKGFTKSLSVLAYLPLALPPVCLAIAYVLLALHGAANYDDPLAGAALDSLVFWFSLLAATLPLALVVAGHGDGETRRIADYRLQIADWSLSSSVRHPSSFILRFLAPSLVPIWFYPLVRLYTLGPWNSGWSLATALFGGALALWAAWRFATRQQLSFAWAALLGLALACLGLATSAGIASGCFLLLAARVIGEQGNTETRRHREGKSTLVLDHTTTQHADDTALLESLLLSSLHRSFAPSLVFVAPLVAVWMAIGAAAAGGVSALAGVAWAALLLGALGLVLHDSWPVSRVYLLASLGMAIAAPFIVLWLIEPVVLQLQGGLTPYGDVLIWPWIGMAFANSAQAQVAAFPSVAILLMLVIVVAIVYLLTQLRDQHATKTNGSVDARWLWQALRDEVPWLGERHHGDAE